MYILCYRQHRAGPSASPQRYRGTAAPGRCFFFRETLSSLTRGIAPDCLVGKSGEKSTARKAWRPLCLSDVPRHRGTPGAPAYGMRLSLLRFLYAVFFISSRERDEIDDKRYTFFYQEFKKIRPLSIFYTIPSVV